MSPPKVSGLCGRRTQRLLPALMLLALTTACATGSQECARQGGAMQPVCLKQQPMCVIPYADAGRPCRDGDDCAGACLATAAGSKGEPAVGECQPTNNPCGCRTYIEDGRIAGGICAD